MYTHSLCRTKWTPSMSPNFTSSNFLTLLLGGGLLCTPSRYTHPHRCISSHSCLPPSGRPHLAPPTSASPSDLLHLLHPLVYALSANPWVTPPPPAVSTLLNIHLIYTDSERLNERLSDGVTDNCMSTKHPSPSLETWGFPFLFSFLSSVLILLLCRMKDKH